MPEKQVPIAVPVFFLFQKKTQALSLFSGAEG
jgi:hypothetical protein